MNFGRSSSPWSILTLTNDQPQLRSSRTTLSSRERPKTQILTTPLSSLNSWRRSTSLRMFYTWRSNFLSLSIMKQHLEPLRSQIKERSLCRRRVHQKLRCQVADQLLSTRLLLPQIYGLRRGRRLESFLRERVSLSWRGINQTCTPKSPNSRRNASLTSRRGRNILQMTIWGRRVFLLHSWNIKM